MATWEPVFGPGLTTIWRDDPTYESSRRKLMWNQLIPDRYPEVIVSPSSVQEVADAVSLARSRGMRVTAQTGGHTWCCPSLRDGGMLIELSQLNQFSIDPEARTATVGPYVKSRPTALALAEHGLAFPTGHCGHTSVAGFLLSGGWGWNAQVWGPSAASVEEIEVVTADGEVVRANEQENADMFWAARGGGSGFFGVVTQFRLRLKTLPRSIITTTYRYPLADIDEVAAWASEIAPTLHPGVEMLVFMTALPPGVASTPGETGVTVEAVAFADSPEEAEKWLAPLETCPVLSHVLTRCTRPTPWGVLYDEMDHMWPENRRNAVEMPWCDEDFAGVLPQLAQYSAAAPSAENLIVGWMNPARPDTVPIPDMAFSMYGRQVVALYAMWQDPADDAANLEWLREVREAIEPLSIGNYLGESDLLAAPTRAQESFGQPQWQRLRELRKRFDPDGLFHDYLGTPE